ncbi:MAG: hypothetical protein ACXV5Q_09095 [Frankiaceae bacterium]
MAAIGVLTSCEDPTPLVTVQSGSTVVKANATTYVRDGEVKRSTQDVPVLPVHQGDKINIDVERNLAAQGWLVAFEGVQVTPVLKDHAASVWVPQFTQQGTLTMRVFAAPATPNGDARGQWVFQLRQVY